MTPDGTDLIIDRLDKLETKLDRYVECQFKKVPLTDCKEHRRSMWARLDSISVKVWVGAGVWLAVQLFVLPVVIWLMTGR